MPRTPPAPRVARTRTSSSSKCTALPLRVTMMTVLSGSARRAPRSESPFLRSKAASPLRLMLANWLSAIRLTAPLRVAMKMYWSTVRSLIATTAVTDSSAALMAMRFWSGVPRVCLVRSSPMLKTRSR